MQALGVSKKTPAEVHSDMMKMFTSIPEEQNEAELSLKMKGWLQSIGAKQISGPTSESEPDEQ